MQGLWAKLNDNRRRCPCRNPQIQVIAINGRFGKHIVRLAASLFLRRQAAVTRAEKPIRKTTLLAGETTRCRLNLPRLFINV